MSDQRLSRICKKLLMRRLTAKKRTALLEARDWPGRCRELTAGLKIEYSDRAERNEGMIMGGGAPASSAGKK
ncbi:uncharacterized protein BDCG_17509 [Blastomyces dermatitidis ER-3]|uniref:Uncharacterized protein n=1 Tax=Ajellomyces dermatitidis (strain ER-3 / ATCC MYA-2586) TaxID=559297 RepID=A0ABX2VZ06_AJEDR|nr:uncharacterized protein BDCG_17509 [Blastomyces dermatitidis ER-3]OAT02375.1 hypothetical protein BDCG_17509 [Blastomyces dermatitidis ER-3]